MGFRGQVYASQRATLLETSSVEAAAGVADASAAVNPRYFRAEAYALRPGATYVLSVLATDVAVGTSATAAARVRVSVGAVVAVVDGGDRTVAAGEALVVSAASSYDEDDPDAPLSYTWAVDGVLLDGKTGATITTDGRGAAYKPELYPWDSKSGFVGAKQISAAGGSLRFILFGVLIWYVLRVIIFPWFVG